MSSPNFGLFAVSSSIAGLATARVCHDHFERVVIVEPEAWLATEEGWKPDSDPTKRVRVRVLQYQALSGDLHPTSLLHTTNVLK